MAITALDFLVFYLLRRDRVFPPRPRILELGESNWYGDVVVDQLYEEIEKAVVDPGRRAELQMRLRDLLGVPRDSTTTGDLNSRLEPLVRAQGYRIMYEIARVFFSTFTDCASYVANDPSTPGSTYRFDLNLPVPLREQFDIVINIGTSEHIFNVHQFYKTAHELTVDGGLMLHTAPFTGWQNHGFYCFQPTFFFDLARANNYQMLLMVFGRIQPFEYVQVQSHDHAVALLKEKKVPDQSMIAVVFRKGRTPAEFAIPTQGFYAGTISPQAARAWHEIRR